MRLPPERSFLTSLGAMLLLLFLFTRPAYSSHTGTFDNTVLECDGAPTNCSSGATLLSSCPHPNSHPSPSPQETRALFASLGSPYPPRVIFATTSKPPAQAPSNSQPTWLVSGVWALGRLLLLDPRANAPYEFNPATGIQPAYDLRRLGELKPTRIQVANDNVWLGATNNALFHLDKYGKLLATVHLDQLTTSDNTRISHVYDWTMIGNWMVGVADFVKGGSSSNESHLAAFFRVELTPGSKVDILDTFPTSDPMHNQYAMSYPMFASVGSEAYFLLLKTRPALMEVSLLMHEVKEVRHLFPQTIRPLSTSVPPEGFLELSTFDQPQALYSSHGQLFLLARHFKAETGGTSWRLIGIDPCTGTEGASIYLRTSAPHLTVVPGDKYWTFFEKDEPDQQLRQPIIGFFRVKREQIEGHQIRQSPSTDSSMRLDSRALSQAQ